MTSLDKLPPTTRYPRAGTRSATRSPTAPPGRRTLSAETTQSVSNSRTGLTSSVASGSTRRPAAASSTAGLTRTNEAS